eukprot:XP_003974290.1 PREDICTED: 5-hydroxytryptamine receptor 3A-like [Takifugu rubripes]
MGKCMKKYDSMRRATLYVVTLFLPSFFLIMLDLFSFLLLPKGVERFFFKVTLILGYTVFMLNTNDLLPVTGDSIPLTNVFLSLCLALMVASLLETIVITNLCHSTHECPVPHWVRVFVLQLLGCLVCLHPEPPCVEDAIIENPAAEPKVSTLVGTSHTPQQLGPLDDEKTLQELRSLGRVLKVLHHQVKGWVSQSSEWVQVGLIIDRLLFGLYILFITVSVITIICFWVNSLNKS